MKRKDKSNAMRIPMIESFLPQDKLKYIRSEINRYKELYRKKEKTFSYSSAVSLDFEKSMEKRRIQAIMNVLEKLPEERKPYVSDFILLNVFQPNYAIMDEECHIMTAAAIWILDRISEAGNLGPELFKLLPRDESMLDDLFTVTLTDSQYDESLIASVEYVLRNRNADIAPLEDDGNGGTRAFTSVLAAEGKDHADVPSRNCFEVLLQLIPQETKDKAALRFKSCYDMWMERFSSLMMLKVEEYEEKREKVNAIGQKINDLRDRADELIEQGNKLMKQKKPSKAPSALNAQQLAEISKLSQMQSSLPFSPVTGMIQNSENSLRRNVQSVLQQLEDLENQHEDGISALNEAMSERSRLVAYLSTHGYITESKYKEQFSSLKESVLLPLPFDDPFEMCFALLYLIEQNDDIPWLYGCCFGMMHEFCDALPWGLYEYDEEEDKYWFNTEESEDGRLAFPGFENSQSKKRGAPAFPDWYARDYRWKGDDNCDARSLAQILYETTGCLMPRNLHRYDDMMKELGKYGIKQNKAIAMLYCMIGLSTMHRQKSALNLDETYIKLFCEEEQSEQNAPEQKKLSRDELEQKTADLEKEIRQLRTALHRAEKEAEDTKKKLVSQKAAAEAEHRELADLREIVFKAEDEQIENEPVKDNSLFPYEVQKNTVVFGGHETWAKAIRPMLKGNIRFVAREMVFDVSIIRHADILWVQTNSMPHRTYYRIVDTARKYNKPIRYFTYASAMKCAEQVLDNDR